MSQLKYVEGKYSRMFATFVLILLVAASVATAQQKPGDSQAPAKGEPTVKDVVSGKYEGSAKAEGVAETKLTLELKSESGKLSGRLITPQGAVEVSEGQPDGWQALAQVRGCWKRGGSGGPASG